MTKTANGLVAFPHLAARIFGVPLMIHPAKADMIIAGLGPRLFGVAELQTAQLAATGERPDPMAYMTQFGEARKPGYRVVGQVGVIDVFGVLAHRGGLDADSAYVQGYDGLARRLDAAVNDPDIGAIVLNMDSPGGEVAGAFDFVDQVRQAGESKPIHAVVGDMAASAGYAIASAAHSISITRTGLAGSIGVVMRHVDASKQLKKAGLSVEHIFAGAHKIDGNPFAPLTKAVRDDLQAEVDQVYDLFVETVAKNRGMDMAAVRDTEARMYTGADAVQVGLADRVETPDQMIARLNGHNETTGEQIMPKRDEETIPLAAQADNKEPSIGDLAARYDKGVSDGAHAERARIGAILNCEEAIGREAQAKTVALTTRLSADEAKVLLSVSPKEVAGTATALDAAMAATGTPAVGDGGGTDEQTQAQAILADYQGATGATVQ